jgi:hypothetical protein
MFIKYVSSERQFSGFPVVVQHLELCSYTKGLNLLSIRDAKPKRPCIEGGEGRLATSKEMPQAGLETAIP